VPAAELDPDLPRLERLSVIETEAPCRRVALGPRDLLAMACTDGTVRTWNVRAGRWAAHCNLAAGVHARSLAWSPWPRHVASAHDDGTVVVWDLEREVPLRFLRPECNGIASMCFSNNGKWLAVVGLDRTVQVFDAQGETRRRFMVPAAPDQVAWSQAPKRVGPSAFAPGDRHLVVAANDGAVVEIDPHGQVQTTWPSAQAVCGLAVSANRLATCSVDGRLRFWAWEGHHVRRQQGARIEHMEFAGGGEFLATAAIDRRLTSWTPDGELLGAALMDGRPAGVGVGDGFIVTASVSGVLETWKTGPPPSTDGRSDDG
jgi:WD40 repeat protein